jgi:hypothetical protein
MVTGAATAAASVPAPASAPVAAAVAAAVAPMPVAALVAPASFAAPAGPTAPSSLKSRSTKFDPIKPALPVTRIRFISFGIAFKSGYNKGHPDIDIFPRDPNNHLFFKEFRTLSSSTVISRISIFILARVGSYDKDNKYL